MGGWDGLAAPRFPGRSGTRVGVVGFDANEAELKPEHVNRDACASLRLLSAGQPWQRRAGFDVGQEQRWDRTNLSPTGAGATGRKDALHGLECACPTAGKTTRVERRGIVGSAHWRAPPRS